MTNSEKIRAMTDEELEVILANFICDMRDHCPLASDEPILTCTECRLEWLRTEVDEYEQKR